MSIDPRIALQSLVTAFEEHLAAAASRRGDKDPVVESAYLAIADAFEVYEEVLYDAYGEVTPLEIYEDDEDDYDAGDADPLDGEEFGGLDGEPGAGRDGGAEDNGNGSALGRPAGR